MAHLCKAHEVSERRACSLGVPRGARTPAPARARPVQSLSGVFGPMAGCRDESETALKGRITALLESGALEDRAGVVDDNVDRRPAIEQLLGRAVDLLAPRQVAEHDLLRVSHH